MYGMALICVIETQHWHDIMHQHREEEKMIIMQHQGGAKQKENPEEWWLGFVCGKKQKSAPPFFFGSNSVLLFLCKKMMPFPWVRHKKTTKFPPSFFNLCKKPDVFETFVCCDAVTGCAYSLYAQSIQHPWAMMTRMYHCSILYRYHDVVKACLASSDGACVSKQVATYV